MTPLLYVREEFENVSRTLKETLRYDYGPEKTLDYYKECTSRLDEIEKRLDKLVDSDPEIPSVLEEVAAVASRISLVERSRLGEFSWPFAETIRQLASRLLAEKTLSGDIVEPIVHMIAEGTGYQIRNEYLTEAHVTRPLTVVAFPRQLKHHVLMHTIFGHELGHTAFYTPTAAGICKNRVVPAIRHGGHLRNTRTVTDWLRLPDAPQSVRERMAARSSDQLFSQNHLDHWLREIVCDLFGLLVFGPAFAAAHRALLEPAFKTDFEVDFENTTHPPYPVRRRILISALRILRWDSPATNAGDGDVHAAEIALFEYINEDGYDAWATVIDDEHLAKALDGLKAIFAGHQDLLSKSPSREVVIALVDRLRRRLPPILETLDGDGVSTTLPMAATHCLYSGWTYWFGRERLLPAPGAKPLTFLQTNRLCDYALLQQQAIDAVASHAATMAAATAAAGGRAGTVQAEVAA